MTQDELPTGSRYPLGVIVLIVISVARSVSIVAGLLNIHGSDFADWLRASSPLPEFPPGSDSGGRGRDPVGWSAHRQHRSPSSACWRGASWAWSLAIVSSGLILAIDLGWWCSGEARYASMLANVVAVFYLNQRDVRAALRGEGAGVTDQSDLELLAAARADPPVHRWRAVLPDGAELVCRGMRPADRNDPARSTRGDPGRRTRPGEARGGRGSAPPARPSSCGSFPSRSTPSSCAAGRRAGAPALLRAGPAGSCRPGGTARRRWTRHLAAVAGPRPGRHGGRGRRARTTRSGRATRASSITAGSSAKVAGSSCTTCSSTR